MTNLAKALALLAALGILVPLSTSQSESAISAELAKKCRALASQAHPTPAPGSKATGAEKAQRDYFKECISKGGEMDK